MRERPVSHGTRQWIGREGAGIAAKHVAGKLVEENDKGERAFAAYFQRREFTVRSGLVHPQKFRPDGPVEVLILLEPPFRPCFAPERDDFS
jgi:hypothetical protein